MRTLFLAVLFCGMAGQLCAQEPHYIPPAMKYNCDTSKWHWIYDYIMLGSGYTPFQYNASENVVRAYMVSGPMDIKKGEPVPTADTLINRLHREIRSFHYRSTILKYGPFSILRYIKTTEEYEEESGKSKLVETEMRYQCYAVKGNSAVSVLFWCDAPDSVIIDKEMYAVLDGIEITSPQGIDRDLHLPYTRAYIDSFLQAESLRYDIDAELFFKREFPEKERKEWFVYLQDRGTYSDTQGDSICQTREKFVEYLRPIIAKEKLYSIGKRRLAMERDLASGFSYEKYYRIKNRTTTGEYRVSDYLDYLYKPGCTNEIAQLQKFGKGEPDASEGLLIAFSRELFADSIVLGEFGFIERASERKADTIYRFVVEIAEQTVRVAIIIIQKQGQKWVIQTPALISPPATGFNSQRWNIYKPDSSSEFILIDNSENAFTLIGNSSISSKWLACDYSWKGEERYQFIYSKCSFYNDNMSFVQKKFNDLNKEMTDLEKMRDSLYTIIFDADTSEAQFYQSSAFRQSRNERMAKADSLSQIIDYTFKEIGWHTTHDKILFTSELHFADIDGDSKNEAYCFAVSNGKLIGAKCFKIDGDKVVTIENAAIDKYVSATETFRLLAQRSIEE
jgi:hypothetical protein